MNPEIEAGVDQTPPTENPEKTINWRDLKTAEQVRGLISGDLVIGFDEPDELDTFADNIGRSFRFQNPRFETLQRSLTSSGRETIMDWYQQARPPSRVLIPKRFTGSLRDIQVMMLEDEQIVQTKGTPLHFPGRRFIAYANLHIGGKGIEGRVAKQCTIGGMQPRKYGSLLVPSFTTASYQNLPTLNVDDAVETIISNSRGIAEDVVRSGLSHMFSAGSPGLGKRS